MRFKFEEKARVGTLYLLGIITKNDRSELLSLLEKTSSMCSFLEIDISGVEKISDECFELLGQYADSEVKGIRSWNSKHKKRAGKFSNNSSISV